MGTCNYITQSDFDLYIYDEDLDETLDEDEAIEQYDFRSMYVFENSKQLAKKLSKDLTFHNIEIKAGYYTGIQTFVTHSHWDYYNNVEDMDNDACKYYFGMCRSIAIRKHKAELNRINKKLLPLFEKELGFDHIRCIGVFSNGEAMYERVK